MTAITFDTFKFIKTLTASGLSEPQAEAISNVLHNIHETTEWATKADISRLEATTKADISRLEAATKADISKLEVDISRLEAATKADISRLEVKLDSKLDAVKWVLTFIASGMIALLIKAFF